MLGHYDENGSWVSIWDNTTLFEPINWNRDQYGSDGVLIRVKHVDPLDAIKEEIAELRKEISELRKELGK